jgi:hypothetical protein
MATPQTRLVGRFWKDRLPTSPSSIGRQAGPMAKPA